MLFKPPIACLLRKQPSISPIIANISQEILRVNTPSLLFLATFRNALDRHLSHFRGPQSSLSSSLCCSLFLCEDLDGVTLMGFTVFKEIILWDYYLSRRGLEKFSNAFDVLECKHNLRLPCKEGPLFCYSESWPLIVVVRTKEEKKR